MAVIFTKNTENQDFGEIIIQPENDDLDSIYENGGLIWRKFK